MKPVLRVLGVIGNGQSKCFGGLIPFFRIFVLHSHFEMLFTVAHCQNGRRRKHCEDEKEREQNSGMH